MYEEDGIDHDATDEIAKILTGRQIVDAGTKTFLTESYYGRDYHEERDYLALDDGTTLLIEANTGCGGCSSGNFWVNSVAAFPNVITRVEVMDKDDRNADGAEEVIEIHVYAEGASATVVSAAGDTGNGYYGRGFSIRVVAPDAKESAS